MFESKFDDSCVYSLEKWAVSLIRWMTKNHAVIVVEGMRGNESFIEFAHLQGIYSANEAASIKNSGFSTKGIVKGFRELDFERCDYKASKTWLCDAGDVTRMMTAVDNEADQEIRFNLLGEDSIINQPSGKKGIMAAFSACAGAPLVFVADAMCPPLLLPSLGYVLCTSLYGAFHLGKDQISREVEYIKKHNCFTWAREKLAISGIDLQYTKKYFCLVTHTKEVTDTSSTSRRFDFWSNNKSTDVTDQTGEDLETWEDIEQGGVSL